MYIRIFFDALVEPFSTSLDLFKFIGYLLKCVLFVIETYCLHSICNMYDMSLLFVNDIVNILNS